MRLFYLSILIIIALFACKAEPELKPTLSDEKLRLVFQDMVVASEAVKLYAKERQDSVRELFRTQISEIHNIPMEEIEFNMDLLKADEKKFLMFCDSVSIFLRDIEKESSYGQGNKSKKKVEVGNKKAEAKEILGIKTDTFFNK